MTAPPEPTREPAPPGVVATLVARLHIDAAVALSLVGPIAWRSPWIAVVFLTTFTLCLISFNSTFDGCNQLQRGAEIVLVSVPAHPPLHGF